MAEIGPFQGAHYTGWLLRDWATVLCPIYDLITPQQQQELYLRSRFNFVQLEFGRDLPQDTARDNKYTRSATTLEQWLKQGVLEINEAPAIYLHDHYFSHQGREYKRRGIIVRVRLQEWEKRVIRPHEGTMAQPKNDRLSLLWALQANTSPILALYEDRHQQISSLLAAQESSKPLLNLRRLNGEAHIVWAITEPEIITKIATDLSRQPLYIADGHHRYESALTYRRERLAYSPSASTEEAFNFVMMTLVDFSDPGLLILPPHRLIRGIAKPTLRELMTNLKVFFKLEEFPLSLPALREKVDELLTNTKEVRFILFGLTAEHLFLLRLPDPTAVSQMMPYFHSELYKTLDVSIADHIILEKLLGFSNDKERALLGYCYDSLEAINRVLAQEYQLAILLSPVKVETVKAIADAADRLPRKSTYFYPKPPAGLILNRLV